jgi:hypothetical protein
MQASRRRTPNTKCVTPARWGNRGAEHGADSNTEFFTDAPGDGCIGKTTGGSSMQINTQKTVQVDATELHLYIKVRDGFAAGLKDAQGEEFGSYEGYVPDFFPGQHYGDYLILNIDLETGQIKNWKKPGAADIEKMLAQGEDD